MARMARMTRMTRVGRRTCQKRYGATSGIFDRSLYPALGGADLWRKLRIDWRGDCGGDIHKALRSNPYRVGGCIDRVPRVGPRCGPTLG
jgi:hypothetical protein